MNLELEPVNVISTWRKVWKDRLKSSETNQPKPFQSHLNEQLEAG